MPGLMRTGMVRRMHGGAVVVPTFTPPDVAGLETWLKADAITGLADGDPVATWEDSHTSNKDATQATSAKQPSYQTSEQNGLAIVRFDGTDDYLDVTGITNNDPTRTLFLVAKQASGVNFRRPLSFVGSAGINVANADWCWSQRADGATVQMGGTPTSWSIVCVRFNSTASLDFFVDGGTASNLDPNDVYQSGSTSLKVGSEGGGAEFWNGDIAEVLVYDSALSDTDRASVRDYLNSKWVVF